jgi:hypothetical protein
MSQFVTKEKTLEIKKFNVKEIGYLLRCIEESSHVGQALELALSCKMKLQENLNQLISTEIEI